MVHGEAPFFQSGFATGGAGTDQIMHRSGGTLTATVPCASKEVATNVANVVFPNFFTKTPLFAELHSTLLARRMRLRPVHNNLQMMTADGHLLPKCPYFPVALTVRV